MSRQTALGCATVRQLCDAFRISRQAFYVARRPRPEPPPRVPATGRGSGASVAELEPAIRAIVDAHPAWGVRKVWATLRRQDLHASHKRVWALMRAWGLTLPPASERTFSRLNGHVVVPFSNRRWATDLTTVWTRQDGVVAVVPLVDCGDRTLLGCAVTKSQDSRAVLAPVEAALRREFATPQGIPHALELRTDHGPQYTGADCHDLCNRWNLVHTFSPVARPTGNAVAERVIQTLKVELVWTRDWQSLDELRAAVADWMISYNDHRPHQALAWATPAEARTRNLNPRPIAA